MKRNIGILICLLLVSLCVFTGCNEEAADVSGQETQGSQEIQENQDNQQLQEDQDVELPDPGVESGGTIDAKLDAFEKNLKENGMKLGERVFKDASGLGAEEGYGLNINDIPVEVYLFDKSSSEEWTVQNLKSAEESQTVTIFGVEMNGETPTLECSFNNGLVIIFPVESMMPHPDKDKIVEIFNQI